MKKLGPVRLSEKCVNCSQFPTKNAMNIGCSLIEVTCNINRKCHPPKTINKFCIRAINTPFMYIYIFISCVQPLIKQCFMFERKVLPTKILINDNIITLCHLNTILIDYPVLEVHLCVWRVSYFLYYILLSRLHFFLSILLFSLHNDWASIISIHLFTYLNM